MRVLWVTLALVLGGTGMLGCGGGDGSSDAGVDGDTDAGISLTPAAAACATAVGQALRTCVATGSTNVRTCLTDQGEACQTRAAAATAVDAIEAAIESGCEDDTAVHEAGFGDLRTVATLVSQIEVSCATNTASLVARAFGGPHAAVWLASDSEDRACLETAHSEAASWLSDALAARVDCLVDIGTGEECDPEALQAVINTEAEGVESAIVEACGALEDLVAVDETVFVDRAQEQLDCMTARATANTSVYASNCQPEAEQTFPRGEYTQVVLDGDRWGTRCGDGSEFAFQVRLAPEGSPLENVLIAMEGGGVCIGVAVDDCSTRPAQLFEALSVEAPTSGIMSNDPEVSPFANWTKIFLPYCNQDVFIGGGTTNVYNEGTFTVERFGAPNVRGAMRYVRNLLWELLDEQDAEGYHADRIQALFGGFSAGSFGTLYNYHWMLDDLQWAHTTAFPDAGFGLDSGGNISVQTLGNLVIAGAPPIGWDALPFLPPYCFTGACAVGPNTLQATAPRLKAVPTQQILMLSHQVDTTQVGTTFFEDVPSWVNALRSAYCETKDLNGVHYYLTNSAESVHVISPREELYTGEVAGVSLRDWLAGAIDDPDNVIDIAAEGDVVKDFPGVEPFDCALPSEPN